MTSESSRSHARSRSRSPAPEPPQKKKKNLHKGFSFAKKPAAEDTEEGVDKRRYRDREDEYKPKRFGGKDDRSRNAERHRERENVAAAASKSDDIPPRRPPPALREDRTPTGPRVGDTKTSEGKKKQDKPKPKPAAPISLIVVTVNDRLGTKAAIPCLPSDTIGDFKKLVAAQIGRAPHEIMLKKQSQRPYKDHITLADYEISNGVQLDLELDVGD